MILVIDNYDSFTYNLVQYLAELGAVVEVHRNDQIDVTGILQRDPEGVLISPGPGTPNEAGVTLSVIAELGGRIPIFGVCLGHQAIGQAYGGSVVRAPRLMHGRTSPIEHNGKGVFAGLASPFIATRYHSLIVQRDTISSELEITAWTSAGEVMGIRHRTLDVEGVQFHPESFLTEHGHAMLQQLLNRLPARGRRIAQVAA
jgi:anthranilate synthase/aminodeoxychorismate synthase-like glutamine amidotransferase